MSQDDQTNTCSICNVSPEDLLILSCNHNLCLSCACEIFSLSHGSSSLKCQICDDQTPLDQETIKCLKEFSKNSEAELPPKPQKSRRSEKEMHFESNRKEVPLKHCLQHNQICLYYCFDCNSANICSQCVLDTTHLSHKVSTIKKSLPIFTSSISNYLNSLHQDKNSLSSYHNLLQNHKEQLKSLLIEKENKLNYFAQEAINMIMTKIQQIKKELAAQHSRNEEILEGSQRQIAQRIYKISQSIKCYDDALKSKNSILLISSFQSIAQKDEQSKPLLPTALPSSNLSLKQPQKFISSLSQLLTLLSLSNSEQFIQPKVSRYKVPPSASKQSNPQQQSSMMNRLSDIKNRDSRKLELSRSMQNAVNIISKLQERVKRS